MTYLARHAMAFRISKDMFLVKTCPFCHDTKGVPDNEYKLGIFRTTGSFNCFRCQAKGSWYEFRNRLSHGRENVEPVQTLRSHLVTAGANSTNTRAGVAQRSRPDAHAQNKRVHNLWKGDFKAVRDYLRDVRGLSEDTLRRYGVGACEMHVRDGDTWRRDQCMTFPMHDADGELVRYKARSVRSKSGMQMLPKDGGWGFFGLHTVPKACAEVILTEGELDAMSVWQATGLPAISLPNGAHSLPVHTLPLLEGFRNIVLWMDADEIGRAGCKHFAKKLGLRRCRIVEIGHLQTADCKDANDILRRGGDVGKLVARAEAIPHDGVVKFDALRESVFDFIVNCGIRHGVQLQSIPRANDILKGHRRGEMTILSGHTGIGKTTFLSQVSLDLCMQGVATMWGSFEVGNVRLASTLLLQMFGALGGRGNLVDEYDVWADRLSALPLLFMKYHGSNSIDVIVDAMDWANYMYDVSHFVLDNLQFMTYGQSGGFSGRRGGGDRFEIMDDAVSRLRHFATGRNCHVSLVVHPRKENDGEAIQLASVFGSAKATQEADNVLLLQRCRDGLAKLEVKKNRFDGECGFVKLRFEKKWRLFRQCDSAEIRMRLSPHGLEMRSVDGAVDDSRESEIGAGGAGDGVGVMRDASRRVGGGIADDGGVRKGVEKEAEAGVEAGSVMCTGQRKGYVVDNAGGNNQIDSNMNGEKEAKEKTSSGDYEEGSVFSHRRVGIQQGVGGVDSGMTWVGLPDDGS